MLGIYGRKKPLPVRPAIDPGEIVAVRAFIVGEDLTEIAVNDKYSPVKGDFIACTNGAVAWHVPKQYFLDNYEVA
jgi:hypothetical protein